MANTSISSKKLVSCLVVPLAVFILFKKKIDEIILAVLVKPIFSYVSPSSWLFDSVVLLLCGLLGYYVIRKMLSGATLPTSWKLLLLVEECVYLTYRFDPLFTYTSFTFLPRLKLLDLINFVLFLIIIIDTFRKTHTKAITQSSDAFIIDDPTVINENNDLFNRKKFIQTLALKIKTTNTPTSSFSIGIVAPWGSGKTTFLASLKREMKHSNSIIIELHLWKFNSSKQIVENFLKLLKERLRPYSFSINSKLKEYSNSLLKSSRQDFIKGLSDVIFLDESIEEQYKNINEEIRRINKKVIVLVDDIDRLDKREIYDVIKLIRDTGSFINTFFIVAYDRNYILSAIEEINVYKVDVFLEKIFQLEFTLPPIALQILKNEIDKEINKILTEKDKIAYAEFGKPETFSGYRIDLTNDYILNMRDVVRFINSFTVNYYFVKDEVYFPDFYNLQLLKFKHPEIFAEFFRRSSDFLVAANRKNYYPPQPLKYALKKINETSENNSETIYEFELFLKVQIGNYKITAKEIKMIAQSFSRIFPQPERPDIKENDYNVHLSVVNPSMFDRYFRLGIEGHLSEIDFSNARQLPQDEFNNKIKEWCSAEPLMRDVENRFVQIQDFDDLQDFKKIVNAIFFFADLPFPKTILPFHRKYIGYDSNALAHLIGKATVKNLFDANEESYVDYLSTLFNNTKVEYTYVHQFVEYLLHDGYYSISHVFSAKEISDFLLTYLKNAFDKSNSIDKMLPHYADCRERIETPNPDGSFKISHLISKEAKSLLRHFIFEKDMDGFILNILKQGRQGNKNFYIDNFVKDVFKKNEVFIRLLKCFKRDSKYKEEFLKFYETLNSNEEIKKNGIPIEFFKVIPIINRYKEE